MRTAGILSVVTHVKEDSAYPVDECGFTYTRSALDNKDHISARLHQVTVKRDKASRRVGAGEYLLQSALALCLHVTPPGFSCECALICPRLHEQYLRLISRRFLHHGIVRTGLWCLCTSDFPAFQGINCLFPADKRGIHGKNPCRDQMLCSRIGSRRNVDNGL